MHSLTLRDGRTLAYHVIGDPDGQPLVYCHGYPGSRFEACMVEEYATAGGVCILSPDRPGLGESDDRPDRTLLDWPADVCELLDSLGIDRVPIVGASGGGPYALACAVRFPERFTRLGLIASLAPLTVPGITRGMRLFDRWGMRASRIAPDAIRVALVAVGLFIKRHPDSFVRHIASGLPDPDRSLLSDPLFAKRMARSFAESFRRSSNGPAHDLHVLSSPWGFSPEDVRIDTLLWYGDADTVVPPGMGRNLGGSIPGCQTRCLGSEGHFSIVVRHAEEILRSMVA